MSRLALAADVGADAGLADLAARLSASRARLIQDFDAAAETLADQGAALEDVAAGFREALAGFENSGLAAASSALSSLRARSAALRDRLAAEGEQLEALSDLVQTARTPLADLSRIIRTISMVSVTARVAASRLAGSSAAGEVLARDMAQLAVDADSGVREVSEHYEALHQRFAEMSTRHVDLHGGVERDLAACLERLGRQAEEIEAERDRVRQAGRSAVDLVDRVGQQVSTALMAVQAGDALSQRLDHVGLALGRIDRAGAGERTAADLGLRIQAAQLDAAAEALASESAVIDTALGGLAAEVDDGLAALAPVRGAIAERAVASFEAETRQAAALLDRSEQDACKLDRLAETAASEVVALGRRLDAIRDVEQRMQLVSLNATIRCSKLAGEGRALVVVAQQLSELSLETRERALAATRPLAEATTLARSMRDALKAQDDPAEPAEAEAADPDGARLETLAGGKEIARAWERLERVAPSAARAANEVASRIAAGAQRAETFREAAGVARAATDPAAELPPGPVPSLLQELRAAYSIESERKIHDKILGRGPDPGPAPAPAAAEPGPATANMDSAFEEF